ncbi:hypothetical protein ACFXTO_020186 [Malus domestica]
MSRATFIPVAKANSVGKASNFNKTRRKPYVLGVLNPSSNQLRRPNRCLGFVLGLKRMPWVVEIERNCFWIGRFEAKAAAPFFAGSSIFKTNSLQI